MFPHLPDRYWLCNVRVPACLISGSISESVTIEPNLDGLALLNIEVRNGRIATILNSPLTSQSTPQIPLEEVLQVDCNHGIALPCFIDVHTHLDKGHIWDRAPNPDGTFESALRTVAQDRDMYWTYEDVYRRMEFGLKCSYAHGTKAIRTHIDCPEPQMAASFKAFQELRDIWRDRLYLQPASLISLDLFMGDYGEQVADRIAELGGILGGVAYVNPDLEPQLDRLFRLAKDRGLDLDFHVDETDDPESNTLLHVAEAAIRNNFTGQIVCGHCCSLAVQDTEVSMKTIELVKQADIGIISLPMCNLYLQDRTSKRTPRWRGVTLLHELRDAGVPVALASDNCRDPFYGFGDHDVMQILAMSTQICHLDRPYGNWSRTVTQTPAGFMNLKDAGQIKVGASADLILCKARSFNELFSRPQGDRIVLRNGQAIDTTLPSYSELD